MNNSSWKKNIIKFALLSLCFSWPIMFAVDGWLVYKYIDSKQIGMAVCILLVGHGIAMFGPAIAAYIVQKSFKKPFPKWNWSKLKYYIICAIAFIVIWSVPAIVGIAFGKFRLDSSIESYYKIYAIIYIFLVPFAGLGEELGWCSFLLSYLPKYIGKTRAVLLAGAIRGIWHLPVLLAPYLYRLANGTESLLSVIIMTLVLTIQLTISNIIFGAAFSFVWFKTKSSPLVGWCHLMTDLARDFIGILVIGYATNKLALLIAQLPVLFLGSWYIEKLMKEEKIKKLKDLFS